MRCGTSFYNGTLGKQLTLRFWPLIALYSVIWAMSLPFVAITAPNPRTDYWETAETILSNVGYIFQWVTLLLAVGFGVLVAMAVCSHLYSTRSAHFTAALPPKRTAMFATHYLTGLLWLVVPFLVMAAIAMGIYQFKLQDFAAVFQVFGPGMASSVGVLLFFYSFAVLCGMLTGHLLALPAFYAIFNGLVGGIWTLLTAIFQEFYYGYPGSVATVPAWVSWCTPALHIFRQDRMSDGNYPLVAAIYAGVGVLMALGAWLLYLKRPMERAGDVVIWAGLRPVFRYGVALCSGLALGSLTRIVLNLGPFGLAVSAILWGVAGCFVAQMFLTKSVRVLRYWKGAGAVALSFAALFGVIQLDLTGYETRVPAPDNVVSVSISGLDSLPRDTASSFLHISTSDSEAISLVTQLHQQLVDQFDTNYFDWSCNSSTTLDLTYTLANGTRISRSYLVPLYVEEESQPGTITYLAHEIVNNRDLMLQSYFFPQMEKNGYRLTGAELYVEYDIDSSSLSASEARKVYKAVLQDIQEGNLPHGLFEYDNIVRRLDLRWISPDVNSASYYGTTASDIYYINVCLTEQAEHTLKVLEELGY